MAQTLEQAQTRLAALPAEIASAKATEASAYEDFRTAENHIERLTGQPA